VGGKWTSFRAFGEQAADKALAYLGLTRKRDTRSMPIGGGRGYERDVLEPNRQMGSLFAWTGVSQERLKILFERYGTRAEAIATYINSGTDSTLESLPDYSFREIAYLVQHEKIIHLDDFLLRRSMLAMLGRLTREMILELTHTLGDILGWDGEQKKVEAARALSILADRHEVRL
ncbi:MAG TPA: glycerol-3-phosphate dehydrogenase C-terminal domain-containing protein, partial [Anaerolineales bacterium]|nr:glycerol-3-phosphate dehydrogenase C-terminal domain-containing protein [Anaerolineales bacterium]